MDNEQQFTPGPWEIDRESFNNPAHDDKFCAIRAEFEDETWVVAEVCGDVAQLQPEANARLIAAAPELYAQLDAMQRKMNCVCKYLPMTGEELPCETCRIRALLAKVSVPRATAAK